MFWFLPNFSRTTSDLWPTINVIVLGDKELAASSTRSIIGRPAIECSTFGRLDFIRVPWPAAKTTTCVSEDPDIIGHYPYVWLFQ